MCVRWLNGLINWKGEITNLFFVEEEIPWPKEYLSNQQKRLPILEISLEFQGVGTKKVVVLMLELAIKLDSGMNAS